MKAAQLRNRAGLGAGAIEGSAVRLDGPQQRSDQAFAVGQRVFHQKFGYGRVRVVDDNKLTVAFEKAGEKKVIDAFVSAA